MCSEGLDGLVGCLFYSATSIFIDFHSVPIGAATH